MKQRTLLSKEAFEIVRTLYLDGLNAKTITKRLNKHNKGRKKIHYPIVREATRAIKLRKEDNFKPDWLLDKASYLQVCPPNWSFSGKFPEGVWCKKPQ